MRVAVSGIPHPMMRQIIGASEGHDTLYRETNFRLMTEGNIRSEMNRIANTGNYLIGEGARFALLGSDLQFIPTPWLNGEKSAEWIDYVNTHFDFFVICTANIFHRRHDPAADVKLLKALKIPVLMMSAGIQRNEDFGPEMPEHFLPLIDVIKRKNVHMFTRGTRTAEFLRYHGVQYVEPVGCPSLFAFPDNVRLAIEGVKTIDVGAPLDILYSGYLGSVPDTVHDINALSQPGTKPRYVIQDEPLLFDYTFTAAPNSRTFNDTNGLITQPVNFPGADQLQHTLAHHVFFSTEQWRAMASQSDFAFARRFHGGVIAAQAGVPTVWIAVDDRTSEMLEFIGFPHMSSALWNAEKDKKRQLWHYLRYFDARQALRHYNEKLERFRSLLQGLGLRK